MINPKEKMLDQLKSQAVPFSAADETDIVAVAMAFGEEIQKYGDPAMAIYALKQQNEELRKALEKIADTDPDDGTPWFHEVADAALALSAEPDGEAKHNVVIDLADRCIKAMLLLAEVEPHLDEWNFPITLNERVTALCNEHFGEVRPSIDNAMRQGE